MDLRRAAIGLHRGSYKMAQKFLDEAIKRKKEYVFDDLKPYMAKIMNNIEKLKRDKKKTAAEKLLMYSTLIQNYTLQQFG